jgi:hypothetical protein
MTNQRQRRYNEGYYQRSSVNDREGFPSEEEIDQEPRSIVSTQPQPGGSVQYTPTTSFGAGGYYQGGGNHGYPTSFDSHQGPYRSDGLTMQQSLSTSGSGNHSHAMYASVVSSCLLHILRSLGELVAIRAKYQLQGSMGTQLDTFMPRGKRKSRRLRVF